MAGKVTTMVLKVDLKCEKCYKKVKKVLCKFPEIQDQVYDEKKDTVTIKVQSCNPEKIRDELYCKGGEAIKCIEIIKPVEKPPTEDKKKDKVEQKDKKDPPPIILGYPPSYPDGWCCWPCYMGIPGGRCCQGYGRLPPPPPPPPPCYDCYCYGGHWNRGCCSRCDGSHSAACVIM
ncbi:hypothetical protein Ancab_033361 [Ancistrocladus abbreviatus]